MTRERYDPPMGDTRITDAPFEALRWVGRHWVHIVIAPVVVIVFTVVHEFAHAVAVWAQGGRVTEFNVIPGGGLWGYVRYEFDGGVEYSPALSRSRRTRCGG